MADTVAIIEWYLFLGVVLLLFQKCTRCFSELNVFTLFVGFFIVRHGITVPFDDDVNEWFAGIDVSSLAIDRYHHSLHLMWMALLGGTYFGRLVFGSARVRFRTFRKEIRSIKPGINPMYLAVLGVVIALIVIYQLQFDASFFKLITGRLTTEEYRAMRDSYGESTNYSVGVGYRLASIARFGVLNLFIYSLFYLRKRAFAWRMLFYLALGLGLLVGLISGQKTPALFICIGLVMAWYYESGKVKINLLRWKMWALIAAALLGVIPTLYSIQYPDQSYEWRLRSTFYRLSSEYDRSLQLYFEIYPNVEPFLHGKSSSLVDKIIGVDMPENKLPERFIPLYYVHSDEDYYNTWNAAFIAVAWADFGYAGVIVESFLVGLLLYSYAWWFSKVRHTALAMGAQVSVMMAATKLSELAFSASLLAFGLLTTMIVYFVLRGRAGTRAAAPILGLTHENPASST